MYIDLKSLRENYGLTQQELAEKSGVSYSAITKYESGARVPKKDQIDKILNCLNANIDDYSVEEHDIRKLREQYGLSREALARLSGVSASSIIKYEQGLRVPRKDTLEKIYTALGVNNPDFANIKNHLTDKNYDVNRIDHEYLVLEIDRIVTDLSPDLAEQLYDYCITLEEFDNARK